MDASGGRPLQDEPAAALARPTGDALIEGLQDGTIDMIATDHAPHSAAEEKSRGPGRQRLMGVVGLETAFPQLYTRLVLPGRADACRSSLELMSVESRDRRFGISHGIPPKASPCAIWARTLRDQTPAEFLNLMGRGTPFQGRHVRGRCHVTVCNGTAVCDG